MTQQIKVKASDSLYHVNVVNLVLSATLCSGVVVESLIL